MVSDHILEPGAVVAGHEVGDGVFVQVLLDHLLQALPEGEGPAAGHAVAALVAGAETGHGDSGAFQERQDFAHAVLVRGLAQAIAAAFAAQAGEDICPD